MILAESLNTLVEVGLTTFLTASWHILAKKSIQAADQEPGKLYLLETFGNNICYNCSLLFKDKPT